MPIVLNYGLGYGPPENKCGGGNPSGGPNFCPQSGGCFNSMQKMQLLKVKGSQIPMRDTKVKTAKLPPAAVGVF